MSGSPPRIAESVVARLHARAKADRWQVSPARFAEVLERSVAHAFSAQPRTDRDVVTYLESLRLEDLALATACADGHDTAWEHFVREQRPLLYRAADAIDPSGGARDLADGVYGELFGVRGSGVPAASLFRYFHGRSSLSTWLRAMLSQRHVDRLRSRRRTEPLPGDDAPNALSAPPSHPDPERGRWLALVQTVLALVLAALDPRDRLRLGCYYGQNLKLAAIGRLLGEHEATVSRHLTRTRREIRLAVELQLRETHKLSDRAIAECLAVAAEDGAVVSLADLESETPERKIAEDGRSKERGGRSVE